MLDEHLERNSFVNNILERIIVAYEDCGKIDVIIRIELLLLLDNLVSVTLILICKVCMVQHLLSRVLVRCQMKSYSFTPLSLKNWLLQFQAL